MLHNKAIQVYLKMQTTYYKEGKYQEAIDLFKKIEAKDSVSSTLYYNIANSYYKLNSVANTIYYYEKALQLDPLNTDAHKQFRVC